MVLVIGLMAWRKWIVMGLALGGVGLALLVRADFHGLPPCPLYSTTGILCPGCGITRATRALLLGDVATAFQRNAVAIILMPFLAVVMTREVAAWAWKRPEWRSQAPGKWGVWIGLVVIVFGILRNLPGFDFLGP